MIVSDFHEINHQVFLNSNQFGKTNVGKWIIILEGCMCKI